jgi:Thiopeptide-type bacteriocin precursor
MSVSKKLDFDLENLPMDVFDLVDSGLTVESLTAGHGMTENGASSVCVTTYCSCCS